MTSLLVRFIQNQFSRNIYEFRPRAGKNILMVCNMQIIVLNKCDYLRKDALANYLQFILLAINE